LWTQQQKLAASDGAALDHLGESVAISGDTVIAGAANDGSGSAYVFVRSGGVWTEQQKLTASDGAYSDWFGASVAINGNTVIVGADGDDDLGDYSGSAYVFVRSGGVWTQQQKLTAPDGALFDHFGKSVAMAGDVMIVGCQGGDALSPDAGSVYCYD
jgi:drug/metabolite transporter superfamily protein YnfA